MRDTTDSGNQGQDALVTPENTAPDALVTPEDMAPDAFAAAGDMAPDVLAAAGDMAPDVLAAAEGTASDVLAAAGDMAPDAFAAAGDMAPDAFAAAEGTAPDVLAAAEGTAPDVLAAAEGTAPDALAAAEGTAPDALAAAEDAALDALLEARLVGQGDASRAPEPIPVADEPRPPLSFGQERLWFLSQLEPDGVEYGSTLGLRLTGELRTDALDRALHGLVDRHEPLRTTFATVDGLAHQVVGRADGPATTCVDLRQLPATEREPRVGELVRAELERPFDLADGPLLRTLLVRLADHEHVLLLNMHHIAADGWSKGIVAGELGELYAAAIAGRPPQLAPLPVRYRDYARWQREQLDDVALTGQLDFWKRELADVPPLELPTDRPRPAVRTTVGALQEFRVPAAVTAGLGELGQRHGGTLFSTLVAASQVLLGRYSRQRDVALATVTTGRDRAELEPLVGFFVNTLVLRSDVDPEAVFTDFLAKVADTVWDALAHQDIPFDRLVDALHIERDPSRTPLVQAAVVLQNTPGGTLALPGLDVREFRPPSVSSIFDLTLEFAETATGELAGTVEYNTDLFDAPTAARLVGHLQVLLAGIAQDPSRAVGDLPLLPDDELRTLTRDWAEHLVDHPADSTVHALVAEQASRTPDAVAVDTGGPDRLTYRELDTGANRLAAHLLDSGAAPGSRVAVCLPRGPEFFTALLAVLKAGCAYVPLDPGHPAERLRYMLADTAAPVCLTSTGLLDRLPAEPARLVCLDREADAIAARPGDAPALRTAADDAAYVIYTSGSTGTPKGVVVEHRSIVRLVCGADYVELRPDDVVAQAADATFDAATFEIWGPLTCGARLAPVDKDTLLDARALTAEIARRGITTMWLTAGVFEQVAAADPNAFGGLRTLLFGGDAVNPRRAAQVLAAAAPPGRLVNGYGPTETTTFATSHHVRTADAAASIPIGRPISNTTVYVLDERRRPVPTGVPGELYVGGPGVARGYLNLPELTAERFVPDPLSGTDSRFYRTGDLVRWLADGTLEFLGRVDNQVKLRGYRIEPAEIEAVLEQHPQVAAAAVLVHASEHRKALVAYVRHTADGDPGEDPLREFAAARLPAYMVPSAFVVLAEFPLTPNGKLDRRALPAPPERDGPLAKDSAPATPAERTLAQVWSEVLGVGRVGTRDNFFDLGGDSILSIQVVAKARRAGLELTSKDLFSRQTIAELARVAVPVTGTRASTGPVSGAAPTTPVQEWFFAHHTRRPAHFNQSVLLTLEPSADAQALERALRALTDHHDALRMRFPVGPRGRSQYNLATDDTLRLERHDLGPLAPGARADALRALAEEAQAGLDPAEGPLARFVLFDHGPGLPPQLLLTVHHLVVDGVSWRILLEDLDRAHRQAARGEDIDLGPKSTSYRDWARALADFTTGGGFAEETAHWSELAARTGRPLPLDHDGENTVGSVEEIRAGLDEEQTKDLLTRVPAAYRTQVNDILLAALALALSRWTGDERTVVDLEGHGREEILDGVDLTRTVGWFTSIFPALLEAPYGLPLGDLIRRTKEALRAVPRRGIGYGALRHLAAPGTLPAASTPEISFNYLGQWHDSSDGTGPYLAQEFDFGVDHSPLEHRPHVLDIVGEVRAGKLDFTFHYSTALHDGPTVRRLADGLTAALGELVRHCLDPESGGATPSDFPLARLDQRAVDRLAGPGTEVEDIYPLTPMQSGMLFHSLAEPGAYLDHVSFLLDGVDDPQALADAWARVVAATPALRTHLAWEDLPEPVQIVRRRTAPEILHLDWTGVPAAEHAELLRQLMDEESAVGLDLATGPLTRLNLVRVTGNAVRVVWTFHHVVLDGWSTSQILADVFALYRRLTGGADAPGGGADATTGGADTGQAEPPARPPFKEYVSWLGGQDTQEAREYWRRALTGFGTPTPLPFDRLPVPGGQSRATELVRVELAAAQARELSGMARRHRLTLSTVVQGAWALLLSRYSGESDVCFGATVSGRPAGLPGVESMVGNFLNTLPVRTEVTGGEKLLDWLGALQREQVEARRFEHLALSEVQALGEVPRGTALFDSIVVFENYPGNDEAAAAHGLRVSDVVARDTTTFPLDLTAYTDEDRLGLLLAFDGELFDRLRVEQMAEHLITLLCAMPDDPDRLLADLPMLSEQERERLLDDWGTGAATGADDGCLHELIAAQAQSTPRAEAVVYGADALSYAELDTRANRLARHLVGSGAGPGTVTAICLERGLDMVVAVLGVLKAGGAYVPLDPKHPADRLEFVLADSAAALLLTQSSLAAALPSGPAPVLCLDTCAGEIDALPDSAPDTAVGPHDLAYVIYTSGSTGRPKGVMVEHRSVSHSSESWKQAYRLDEGAVRQLSVASMSFDVFVSDLVHALCHGGTLVIAPAEAATDPGRLLDLMSSARVTHLETVPSLANVLVEEAARRGGGLPPLRVLAVGSDYWRTEDCRRLLEQADPATTVVNSYGVTEATVESCLYTVVRGALPRTAGVPVGRAIPGVRTYILDEAMRPVPAGVTGELHLGGPGVARGYLNRPELTEQRFVPDPFGQDPHGRLYRTGDRARYLPDGTVEFAGRGDDQVKVRGFRIELGEVEAALRSHPAVADTVVAAHRDGSATRLAGYVTVLPGESFDPGGLRTHLTALLPGYMVPAAFVELAALPLNANGKVDRRALPAPGPAEPLRTAHVAPRNPVEEALALIWAEVLRTDRVGVEDNFFDLGGDSILSIQVVTRARQKGLTLSSKDIFAHQTIAELAFATGADGPAAPAAPASQPVAGRVPLTPIQRSFFRHHTAAPHHYDMSVLLDLAQRPDRQALAAALDALTEHHDALRMRFTSSYGRWQQENAPADASGWPLETADLSGAADPDLALHEAATRCQASLDLGEGPLVRALLVDGDAGADGAGGTPVPEGSTGGTPRLFLAAHHLVMDAVSWQVLLTDLETAYAQAAAGRPVDLGPRTTSFRDWSMRLSEHTTAGGFDDELDHWVTVGRRDRTPLPVDSSGTPTVGSARSVRVTLDRERTRALLHDVPAAYRTQVNDVLLTALGQALADWTRTPDVLLDLEGHGREDLFDDVDTSRTVGWFTSSFPVSLHLGEGNGDGGGDGGGDGDWGERLKSVKEQLRGIPRRGIGYGALRHLSPAGAPAEILAETPRAQVGFNYLGQSAGQQSGQQSGQHGESEQNALIGGARLGFGTEQAPDDLLEYLLDIVVQVRDGVLEADLYYSADIHRETTVQEVGDRFVQGLGALVEHCGAHPAGGATPSDFPLARIEQKTLDLLTARSGRIDDLYPLTPMQNGLLFHSLTEAGDGIYLGQLSFVLDGVDDPEALAEAWQRLAGRTPVLRTSILWEDVPVPLQVVHQAVRIPLETLDWTDLTDAEREARLEQLLRDDRTHGIDLSQAPLTRVVLVVESARSVRVVWTTHHLLLDGWSSAELISELLGHYLQVRGLDAEAAPTRRPFRDYVAWLADQNVEAAERHWREALEGFTEPTPLPVDHGGKDVLRAGSEAAVTFSLPADLSARLHELTRKHRLTVNTLAQGAWALLLSRYSGRTDVCFGSTVSGRPADLPGAESIVGIFINNLPVRTEVDARSDLLGWLSAIQRDQVESRQYEFISLAQIREWSEIPAGTNVFDSYVVFENYPFDGEMGAEQGVRIRDARSLEPTNYSLVLAVYAGDALSFRLAYEPNLFEEETVTRVMGDLRALLEDIAEDPGRTLSQLMAVGPEHRREVLEGHQGPEIAYDAGRGVHELFAEQAALTPDATAVVSGSDALTFAELDRRANKLAHHLIDLGVTDQAPVAVCVARGTDLMTCLLAVLKAGGTYAPLDPAAPAERLAHLLDDLGATVVLTHDHLRERLPSGGATTVAVDRDRQRIDSCPPTAPQRPVAPDAAAYIIHTSGSTGRPKGVVVEHGSLANLYDSHRRTVFGPVAHHAGGGPLRVAHLAPASFDASWNPVLWMVHGNELHLVDDDTRRDAAALTDYVTAHGIEFLQTTPTHFQQLLDCGLLDRPDLRLRGLALGGEAISGALWNRLRARDSLLSFNFYGPTESTVDALICPLADSPRPVLGRPLQNIRAYVLGDDLEVLPVGAPGELVLAGAGLARCYLGRPDLTEQAFPRAPFAPDERLYRTGDRVRRLSDGSLEFLGRRDNQIKLRGYRIELGEIENTLAGHPDVSRAVVVVQGEEEARRLVGYVRPADGRAPDTAGLAAFLAAGLPEYMVPAAFVALDEFPLNANGKVDVGALPSPGTATADDTEWIAPRSGTERAVAGLWADALGLERVGAHDDFFQLGGHSIISLKVLTRVRKTFGVRPSFRDLLNTSTVAGFAELIEELLLSQLEEAAAQESTTVREG
ncbi:amino acid adenylation domain-containing protein [Streptomyces sp. NPDC021093]|uniref:amino acid adenylation domain-containing protein n=1 Tax=Streptomyces sp. NPDC021093 TaxID=3365112 RepID=UPI0037BC9ADE